MNTSFPVLYSFLRCPYAMRARLAIAQSEIVVELREVVLRDKPQALIDVSPKATVPVLVLSDGRVIEESLDIMHWALKQNDPNGWLEATGEELVHENDSVFKKHLDRYKYAQRYPEHPQVYYREQGEKFLQRLEKRLLSQAFLSGNQMGFVDAAVLPFVRQFAFVDHDWFNNSLYVNVKLWLDTFLDSEDFKSIMIKYPQWHFGDNVVLFPQALVDH